METLDFASLYQPIRILLMILSQQLREHDYKTLVETNEKEPI